jgi:hypothetical protein
MTKKNKKKKQNAEKVMDEIPLEKVSDSIYLVTKENADLEFLVNLTTFREMPCVLCFRPTKRRAWSIPQIEGAEESTMFTSIYAVCENHPEGSQTEFLLTKNVETKVLQWMARMGISV